jgi:hypothetical protein
MKTFVLAALLAAISSIDLAQAQTTKWFPLSNSMYVMKTKDNDKIVLTAGLDTRDNEVSFRVLDLTEFTCKNGVFSKPENVSPFRINGKYIRMLSMCINGSQYVAPETPEGRRYFHVEVMSGNMITIETNMNQKLRFKGIFPPDFLKKLMESENAM